MDNNIRVLERTANGGGIEATIKLARARDRADAFDVDSIVIGGDTWEIDTINEMDGGLWQIECGSVEFTVALTSEDAGKQAREYWEDMAKSDPTEFRHMVGDECLVSWALGQSAGPGTAQVNSLSDWLDLSLNAPEEHFASYDGEECDIGRIGSVLLGDLGAIPTVAYRRN